MKFNPKPGDKIVCNNGEEFICCTKETIEEWLGIELYYNEDIFGYSGEPQEWQDWDHTGRAKGFYVDDCNIREVIPAESKEVVKEDEPRYTVEEVTEAFANALHLSWAGGRQKGINKVKDYLSKKHNPEYQEYLRLKAIYE